MAYCKFKKTIEGIKNTAVWEIREEILNRLKNDHSVERMWIMNKTDDELIQRFVFDVCAYGQIGKTSYVNWIVESYLDGGIHLIEDLPKVKEALQEFEILIPPKERNIYFYCGLKGCKKEKRDRPRPFVMADARKPEAWGNNGLYSLLDKHRPPEKPASEYPHSKNFQKDVIHSDMNGIVIKPSSVESAQHWGKGTRWCTAAENENNNMFEHYYNRGRDPLFIIINPRNPREKYQVHAATEQMMDPQDSPVSIEFLEDKFPTLFKVITEESRHGILLPNIKSNLIPSEGEFTLGTHNFVERIKQWDSDNNVQFYLYTHNFVYPEDQQIGIGTVNAHCMHCLQLYDLREINTLIINPRFGHSFSGLELGGVRNMYVYANKPVENLNLDPVDELTFDWFFNQPIEQLDLKNVGRLTLIGKFNKPIGNLNLKNVRDLTLGGSFNQPVDGLKFPSVENLTFGHDFNQPISNLDLTNVKKLTLGYAFNQRLGDLKGVEHLDIGGNFIPGQHSDFASSIKNVTSITLRHYLNWFVSPIWPMEKVTNLFLVGRFNRGIEDMDLKNVENLTLGDHFNQPIEKLNLNGIRTLTILGDGFNQPIEALELKEVRNLTMGDRFNQPILGLDLSNVQNLKLGDGFNQPIVGLNLRNVATLELGHDFNQPVEGLDLRDISTLKIKIGHHPLSGLNLENVRRLTLYGSYYSLHDLDLGNVRHLTLRNYRGSLEGIDLGNLEELVVDTVSIPGGLNLERLQKLGFKYSERDDEMLLDKLKDLSDINIEIYGERGYDRHILESD